MKKRFVAITAAEIYTQIHQLLMVLKLNHYQNRTFAGHEALGRIYSTVNGLADTITEQLIGYSGTYPQSFNIGNVTKTSIPEIADHIINLSGQIEQYAEENGYCNIENLAQELSGEGAQLKFLGNLS